MRLTCLTLIWLFFHIAVSAQDTKFYVNADATEILDGSYVRIEFVLENGQGHGYKAPPFSSFDIISGPSRSSSFQSFNGVVRQSLSYSYVLVPKRTGSLTIGSAEITSGGQVYTTQPLTIEVLPNKGGPAADARELYVETVLTDTIAYVGQQVLLEYKLYTTIDVRSINFESEEEVEGFYNVPLQTRNNWSREIIDGTEYKTMVIRSIALFPQQTGRYEVAPVNILAGIPDPSSNRSFFFSSQLLRKNLRAPGKTVEVREKPPTDILSYSGATGQYSMNVDSPTRPGITTDDAITVRMDIRGNGDSKTVTAPDWTLPDGLDMYDPNMLADEVTPTRSGLRHHKVFEYLIVPKEPGRFILNPSFTYFDPDSNSYITIEKTIGPFNVAQGSVKVPGAQTNAGNQLSDIYATTRLTKISDHAQYTMLLWIILALLVSGMAGIYLYRLYLETSGRKDPSFLMAKNAHKKAMQRLSIAREKMNAHSGKEFYTELSLALKIYLGEKWHIPAVHLNKEDIVSRLRERRGSEAATLAREILDACEWALYTPQSQQQTEDTYNKAVQLISQLES